MTQRPAPASATSEAPEPEPDPPVPAPDPAPTVNGVEETTSSSARESELRPKASTVTDVSPTTAGPPATGRDTSTPSTCNVTPGPENSPLPCPVATSWPPTSNRADVTGPVTVARRDTRPDRLCPDSGAHVEPSVEYSTSPTTGRAWSFRTASSALGMPAPRYSRSPSGAARRAQLEAKPACLRANARI